MLGKIILVCLYTIFVLYTISIFIYSYNKVKTRRDIIRYESKIENILFITFTIGAIIIAINRNNTIAIYICVSIILLFTTDYIFNRTFNKKLLTIANDNIKLMRELYSELSMYAIEELIDISYSIEEKQQFFKDLDELKVDYVTKYNLKSFKRVINDYYKMIENIKLLEEERKTNLNRIKKKRDMFNSKRNKQLNISELIINNLILLDINIEKINSLNTKEEIINTIKKQYKKLAYKYHPDTNKDINSNHKFIEITNAYNLLKEYFNS